MADNNRIRKGSLQFYPRVRAKKILPRVNWTQINTPDTKLAGFIGYKVSMTSVFVHDNSQDSLTKGKRIVIPATIVECPSMKIYSVRVYKNKKLSQEFVVSNEKKLKRKLKVSKQVKQLPENLEFDDLRVLVYSNVDKTSIGTKKPYFSEIKISGENSSEKLAWVKSNIGKDIFLTDIFNQGLLDVHAVTKGYGTQGPVKRFGIALKASKSEKGQRRPGSLAPWTPSRVTFRAPQAGQTGFHTRVSYNSLILKIGKIDSDNINPKQGFHKYGNIKTEYILLKGSVQGPTKRPLILTLPKRATKYKQKENYEVLSIR